jgi:hypothetical protein
MSMRAAQTSSLRIVSSFLTKLVLPHVVAACTRGNVMDVSPPLILAEVTREYNKLLRLVPFNMIQKFCGLRTRTYPSMVCNPS